jgi:tubulin--tyrosine ligase
MFDEEFRPYLIEVNSNPSLEPSNNALNKLFTQMLDNTFRIAIEPLFPPTEGYSLKKGSIGVETCPENRFDLIFDERIDGPDLLKKFEKIGKKELKELEDINELAGSEDEHEADVSEVDLQNQNNEGGDEDITAFMIQEIPL